METIERTFRGQHLAFNCPDDAAGILIANFYHEEEHITALCEQIAQSPPGLVFDVGAQMGATALALATTGMEVWAFEPHAPFVELLRTNAMANPWARIRIFPTAVHATARTMVLYGEKVEPMPSLIAKPESPILRTKETLREVNCLALSQLPPPVAVKIDVEGAENAVLSGLHTRPDTLAVELHPLVETPNMALFEGYELVREEPRGFENLTIWRRA